MCSTKSVVPGILNLESFEIFQSKYMRMVLFLEFINKVILISGINRYICSSNLYNNLNGSRSVKNWIVLGAWLFHSFAHSILRFTGCTLQSNTVLVDLLSSLLVLM